MPAQATEEDVFHWLRSGDPRMVAWGAYFAAKDHRQDMVSELAQLAQAWQPLPSGNTTAKEATFRAPWNK